MVGLVGGLLVPVHGQQPEARLKLHPANDPVPPATFVSSRSLSLRTVSRLSVSFLGDNFFCIGLPLHEWRDETGGEPLAATRLAKLRRGSRLALDLAEITPA